MRFVKYHGLGNDFIVVEDPAPALSSKLAIDVCRRGFSVGADGLMRLAPPVTGGAHVRMELCNSDGSLPEMCGNGIRCLVKHAVDARGMRENPLVVDTPNGALACRWSRDAVSGEVGSVEVAMGRPRFAAAEIPLDTEHLRADGDLFALDCAGESISGLPVNTGNPHFVVFGEASRDLALKWGPSLEVHPAFPERANIEFVEVVDRGEAGEPRLRVVVWERGCGLTQACGTGATASAVAALQLGHVVSGKPVRVELPGGQLRITVAPDYSQAWMDGPVERVYRGEI